METINEIRARIKANRRDEYDWNDEYENGKVVGLTIALLIIDEVEREHPVPSDVEEAAEMAAKLKYPYEGGTKGAICQLEIPIYREGFKAGAEWQRERMMKEAVSGLYGEGDFGVPCINLDKHLELDTYQPVSVIIIKKEK